MEPHDSIPTAASPLPAGNIAPAIPLNPQITSPEGVTVKPEALRTTKKIEQMENFASSSTQGKELTSHEVTPRVTANDPISETAHHVLGTPPKSSMHL